MEKPDTDHSITLDDFGIITRFFQMFLDFLDITQQLPCYGAFTASHPEVDTMITERRGSVMILLLLCENAARLRASGHLNDALWQEMHARLLNAVLSSEQLIEVLQHDLKAFEAREAPRLTGAPRLLN